MVFVKQTVRIHFRTVSLFRLVMGFTPKKSINFNLHWQLTASNTRETQHLKLAVSAKDNLRPTCIRLLFLVLTQGMVS